MGISTGHKLLPYADVQLSLTNNRMVRLLMKSDRSGVRSKVGVRQIGVRKGHTED